MPGDDNDASFVEGSIAAAESILELTGRGRSIRFDKVYSLTCSRVDFEPDPRIVKETIRICKKGPDIRQNSCKYLSGLYTSLAEKASQDSGIPISGQNLNFGFKAIFSWDYNLIEPLVLKWIDRNDYPDVISDKQVEDHLKDATLVPLRVNDVRLRHCIARTLDMSGYVKRSTRGHGWDNERSTWVLVIMELARYYERLAGL